MTAIVRFHDRALEPIASLLIRTLLVPEVYWQPRWLAGEADLLAIDRGGRGDVHLVEIKTNGCQALDAAPLLLKASAHFRWLAYPVDRPPPSERLIELDATTGPGRIGLIEVFDMNEGRLGAKVVLQAERFAVMLHDAVDQFRAERRPDQSFG